MRYDQVMVAEASQFTGTFTALTLSLGWLGRLIPRLPELYFDSSFRLVVSVYGVPVQSVRNWRGRIPASYRARANLSTGSAGALDIEICSYTAM